jgi:Fe-S-cluster containining protein
MRRPKHGRRTDRTSLPIVRLDAALQSNDVLMAEVPVRFFDERLQLSITVPNRATSIRELLPIFRCLADTVVGAGIRAVEMQGERISCCAGCGACCRQPVPISFAEARAVARLVDTMPEPRRQQVRQRFADAIARLDQAGLLNRLQETNTGEETTAIGLAYFRLGIPCPFLENESCSIHADRPVACREYLVTSPAEECSRPEAERVRGVPMPAQVGRAMRNVERRESNSDSGYVPLVLALDWSANNPEPPPKTPAAEIVKQFLAELQAEGGSDPNAT